MLCSGWLVILMKLAISSAFIWHREKVMANNSNTKLCVLLFTLWMSTVKFLFWTLMRCVFLFAAKMLNFVKLKICAALVIFNSCWFVDSSLFLTNAQHFFPFSFIFLRFSVSLVILFIFLFCCTLCQMHCDFSTAFKLSCYWSWHKIISTFKFKCRKQLKSK